jgi:hypothetical protein
MIPCKVGENSYIGFNRTKSPLNQRVRTGLKGGMAHFALHKVCQQVLHTYGIWRGIGRRRVRPLRRIAFKHTAT